MYQVSVAFLPASCPAVAVALPPIPDRAYAVGSDISAYTVHQPTLLEPNTHTVSLPFVTQSGCSTTDSPKPLIYASKASRASLSPPSLFPLAVTYVVIWDPGVSTTSTHPGFRSLR
ncbi:hypothetical protein ASPACDRAFT_122689 [Aspergillus aculeatus ATCC 16872]|uniref:Uncharacterized protein n=1 Tax=Aspergillus aculeatus (strain ATCC 16872 / CBS 172.66 / WB 5094) TaxID=690307 RepID=A0A1L9WP69_ASPA1|nr:uncharacterized protein ASPACDRAFT_122689 [Aspergillus aculeatus ATCC 16872]OJJ97920.1 hypothetical protein ASPACDRAFT_122689 [Aspergillus aculeatus ATCC 16872]